MRFPGRLLPAVVLVTALAACSPAALPEPVEVETCDGLVPVGVVYVERMVEALAGRSLGVITGEEPAPPEIAELIDLGRELDLRASRLGCDPAVINAAVNVETADLQSDDPVAAHFLDIVRAGVVASLPPPPTTTTTVAP